MVAERDRISGYCVDQMNCGLVSCGLAVRPFPPSENCTASPPTFCHQRRMPPQAVALPLYIDFGATFLFAVTGAMFAIRRHYDWVGLFVLALCTGLGGGLLRDGLFLNDGVPAAMRHAGYLWAVVAGCLAAGLFHQPVAKLDRVFLYVDALGVGAYGVVGTTKAAAAASLSRRPSLLGSSMPSAAASFATS